jgi:small basic protein
LTHVFRAAAFLLLPFSFIALIAWATAGSASGSTTDPIRGAVWIWLGAHHIPFQLALPPTGLAGYLTYLPLGGVVLPFLAIRAAFARAIDRLSGYFHDINGVRIIFSALYALLVTVLAFISRSTAVTPQWYLAPLIAFVISLLATMTAGTKVLPSKAVRVATRITALILGAGFILVSILIFINLNQVRDISISLEPGIFGGALLLFLNILYLPNAAVAVAAYFSGTGLAVGAGTLISPLGYHLGQIPALPLLGILPTTREPLALLGILFFIGLGVLLAQLSSQYGLQIFIQSYIFTVLSCLILAYCASGSLITTEMGAMGVSIWKFVLSIATEIGIGAVVTLAVKNRSAR